MSDQAEGEPHLKHVSVFTDGAAVPNPGAGGYGVVLRYGEHAKELSGGFRRTTNNRMELMAAIVGLEALKEKCRVMLHSDSKYLVDAIRFGAAFKRRNAAWAANVSGSRRVKNADLWERLLAAYDRHEVELVWVKGHAGIADNERCDALAMSACQRPGLPPDEGYIEDERAPAGRAAESNVKIVTEGQACRKCGTPVVKRTTRRRAKATQTYRFSWYLFCPKCKAMYMVEEAKQPIGGDEAGAAEAARQPNRNGQLFPT
ncbi:MAG TPA: ribonuclease HI [Pirellulales bacterium]|nr:ribonuclease HI [Pirellulales bacterium]